MKWLLRGQGLRFLQEERGKRFWINLGLKAF
jgi:hypothetical protein